VIEDVRDGLTVLRFEGPAFDGSLRHIVTTRRGTDGGEFRPDLGRAADRRRVAQLLGVPERAVAFVNQVHGDRVLIVDADTGDGCAGDADGLVTGDTRIALAVKGADCPLVLLGDAEGRAAAVVHSGWRGTAAHVVGNAVGILIERFGCRASSLFAGISPCIRPCCYEVGEDVAVRFEAGFSTGVVVRRAGDRAFVDLGAAIRDDLCAAGVPSDRVETARLCTSCRTDLLYSYRREGERAGRNVLLACLD